MRTYKDFLFNTEPPAPRPVSKALLKPFHEWLLNEYESYSFIIFAVFGHFFLILEMQSFGTGADKDCCFLDKLLKSKLLWKQSLVSTCLLKQLVAIHLTLEGAEVPDKAWLLGVPHFPVDTPFC